MFHAAASNAVTSLNPTIGLGSFLKRPEVDPVEDARDPVAAPGAEDRACLRVCDRDLQILRAGCVLPGEESEALERVLADLWPESPSPQPLQSFVERRIVPQRSGGGEDDHTVIRP